MVQYCTGWSQFQPLNIQHVGEDSHKLTLPDASTLDEAHDYLPEHQYRPLASIKLYCFKPGSRSVSEQLVTCSSTAQQLNPQSFNC